MYIFSHKQLKTCQYFVNLGVAIPQFPKYPGAAKLLKTNTPQFPGNQNSPISKEPASCNAPVLWKLVIHFTVGVKLQAHGTEFLDNSPVPKAPGSRFKSPIT